MLTHPFQFDYSIDFSRLLKLSILVYKGYMYTYSNNYARIMLIIVKSNLCSEYTAVTAVKIL